MTKKIKKIRAVTPFFLFFAVASATKKQDPLELESKRKKESQ